jgi:glycosyltransferase involved in cell wall biosynthesis
LKTSLLTSVYSKNSCEELNRCFDSIRNQVYIPEEILLIVDGAIDDFLLESIKNWQQILPLKIYSLKVNMGLAYVLNYGLGLCKSDWVFRMDMDDVCSKDRFQKQRDFIIANPEIDILGGDILCFETFPNYYSGRKVPSTPDAIKRFMKFRNPVNHPTVFFNRKKILNIGGYPSARLGQDYLLWIKANKNGLRIENMKEVLVLMQVDKRSYSRRGLANLRYDVRPYRVMYEYEITNSIEFISGVLLRFMFCLYATARGISAK